ncbi:MAG: SNF2 helicase associated domain-containing protein, partial [Butyrivibrio sp.]|nr:SNF2 helicase associated domain-containing protein [Butyrivibrio sp.]
MFDRANIRKETTPAVYVRARSLYTSGHVGNVNATGDLSSVLISGSILGSHYDKRYLASANINVNTGDIIECKCSCPAASMFRVCKHCAALLLYYVDHHDSDYMLSSSEFAEENILPETSATESFFNKNSYENRNVSGAGRTFSSEKLSSHEKYTSFDTLKLLREYANNVNFLPFQGASDINLEPHLSLKNDKLELEFRIGQSKKYVVKDIGSFITAVNENIVLSYGKTFSFVHNISAFDSSSRDLIGFLYKYFKEKAARTSSFYHGYTGIDLLNIPHKRTIELCGHEIDDFMNAVKNSTFYLKKDDYRNPYPQERIYTITYDMPDLSMSITGSDEGISFDVKDFSVIEGYDYFFFIESGNIHMIDIKDINDIIPFLRFNCKRVPAREKFIAKAAIPTFIGTMLPILKKYFNI